MKYDLDISVDEKLERLSNATLELLDCESDFFHIKEDAYTPSHVYDYEQWKKEQKR